MLRLEEAVGYVRWGSGGQRWGQLGVGFECAEGAVHYVLL